MAATRTRPTASANDSGPVATAGAKAREAGDAVAVAARRARGPALAAGAAAAGLAGGLAIGSRMGTKRRGLAALLSPRPRVLGMPVGPKPGVLRVAEALRDGARHAGSATKQVSDATSEVRAAREQLERLNRRSPVEVLLDGLTHRRGAHRREG